MTTFTFNNYDDIIDVRDVIERYEELEDEMQSQYADYTETTADPMEYDDWLYGNDCQEILELKNELQQIEALLDDLKGYGGDEQWRGDWYPITLIRESYFTDYCEELVSDIGDLPTNIPDYIVIDWEATARNLKVDYSEVEIDGVTYFYR